MEAKSNFMRQALWRTALAIPSILTLVYVFFPENLIHFINWTCAVAEFLCVPSGYYSDSLNTALFDMQVYSVAMGELRRITPVSCAICVLVLIYPLLHSKAARERSRVVLFLKEELLNHNGWLHASLAVILIFISAYILFLSRSLIFVDVTTYFKFLITAPVSVIFYWCLFVISFVAGSLVLEVIIANGASLGIKRKRQ